MEELSLIFATFAGLVAGTMYLSEAVKRAISVKGVGAVIISIVVPFLVCTVGYYLKAGIFETVELWQAGVYAAAVALIDNLGYQIPAVKKAVQWIFDVFKKKK